MRSTAHSWIYTATGAVIVVAVLLLVPDTRPHHYLIAVVTAIAIGIVEALHKRHDKKEGGMSGHTPGRFTHEGERPDGAAPTARAHSDTRSPALILAADISVLCACGAHVNVTGGDATLRGDCDRCGRTFVGRARVYVVEVDE